MVCARIFGDFCARDFAIDWKSALVPQDYVNNQFLEEQLICNLEGQIGNVFMFGNLRMGASIRLKKCARTSSFERANGAINMHSRGPTEQ